MMQEQLSRTELLIGSEGLEKLKKARVAVFGIGGVGSFVAEALARAGIGSITIVDNDTISYSNLNNRERIHLVFRTEAVELIAPFTGTADQSPLGEFLGDGLVRFGPCAGAYRATG